MKSESSSYMENIFSMKFSMKRSFQTYTNSSESKKRMSVSQIILQN